MQPSHDTHSDALLAQAGWPQVADALLEGVSRDLAGRVASLEGMLQLFSFDEGPSPLAPFLKQEVTPAAVDAGAPRGRTGADQPGRERPAAAGAASTACRADECLRRPGHRRTGPADPSLAPLLTGAALRNLGRRQRGGAAGSASGSDDSWGWPDHRPSLDRDRVQTGVCSVPLEQGSRGGNLRGGKGARWKLDPTCPGWTSGVADAAPLGSALTGIGPARGLSVSWPAALPSWRPCGACWHPARASAAAAHPGSPRSAHRDR